MRDAREGGPPTSREIGGKSYRTGALLLLRHDRGSSPGISSRPGVTATTDMAVLPGVLGYRTLRRTVQVRLGLDLGFRILDFGFLTAIDDIELNSSDFAIFTIRNPESAFRNRRPGGTPIFVVSRQQFMKYPSWSTCLTVPIPAMVKSV